MQSKLFFLPTQELEDLKSLNVPHCYYAYPNLI